MPLGTKCACSKHDWNERLRPATRSQAGWVSSPPCSETQSEKLEVNWVTNEQGDTVTQMTEDSRDFQHSSHVKYYGGIDTFYSIVASWNVDRESQRQLNIERCMREFRVWCGPSGNQDAQGIWHICGQFWLNSASEVARNEALSDFFSFFFFPPGRDQLNLTYKT